MKIRQGFVSNSSSSSFVIKKKYLTECQINAIRNHISYANEHFEDDYEVGGTAETEAWKLKEDEEVIRGCTYLDNFNMEKFMRLLGIQYGIAEFSDGEGFYFED